MTATGIEIPKRTARLVMVGFVLVASLSGTARAGTYSPLTIPEPDHAADAQVLPLFNLLQSTCSQLTGIDPGKWAALATAARTTASACSAAPDKELCPQLVGLLPVLRTACINLSQYKLTPEDWSALRNLRNLDPSHQLRLKAYAAAANTDPNDRTWAAVLKSVKATGLQEALGDLSQSLLPDSSVVIAGLSKFLADRAKTEALMFLQQRLQKICSTEIPEAAAAGQPATGLTSRPPADTEGTGDTANTRTKLTVSAYLPNLCATVQEDDSAISLLSLGKRLRQAAEDDLKRLPDFVLHRLQQKAPEHEAKIVVIRITLAYAQAIHDGRLPLDILAGIAQAPGTWCTSQKNHCKPLLENLRKLARTVNRFRPLFDKVAVESRKPMGGFKVISVLLVEDTYAPVPVDKLTGTWSKLVTVYLALEELAKQVVAAAKIVDKPDKEAAVRRLAARMLLTGARLLMEQVEATHRELLRKGIRVGELLLDRDYPAVVTQSLQLASAITTKMDKLPASLNTLLALATELSTAKTSDEVATALEAAAAPPGGYRAKFQRSFMLSINGVVGGSLYWNAARADGLSGRDFLDSELGFSPAAMLGLHATVGLRDRVALGLLIPVLDLGAPVRARLEEDSTQGLDSSNATATAEVEGTNSVGLSQLVSLGAYFTAQLYWTGPLIAGFGVTYTPEINRMNIQANGLTETRTVDALRFGFFLGVDLTLMPLWN